MNRPSAVLLDRDGTLCEEVGYINHLDRLRVFPWTAPAIRKLNEAGIPAIVLTNQSGVGRGYFPEELVEQVHQKMERELAAHSARVDAIYYCPHHPEARVDAYRRICRCRKPATGMAEDAARQFGLDLQSCCVIGDTGRDVQLGFNIGASTVLVLTGYGKGSYEYQRHLWPRMPDRVAADLLEAVDALLADRLR